MKLHELAEGIDYNTFYRVLKPVKSWKLSGYTPSNEYYGSSRIHRAKYEPIELEADDEIHRLVGGLFFVQLFNEGSTQKPGISEAVSEGRMTKPNEDRSAFEKSYSYDDPNVDVLNKLVADGSIEKIVPPAKAHKVKSYRS